MLGRLAERSGRPTGGGRADDQPVPWHYHLHELQRSQPTALPRWFQDEEVTVTIEAGLVQGRMARPRRQLVLDWYDLHVDELMDNWSRARDRRPLAQINPLP
jgi:hypothetical protein